jgi:hypothetical protein
MLSFRGTLTDERVDVSCRKSWSAINADYISIISFDFFPSGILSKFPNAFLALHMGVTPT